MSDKKRIITAPGYVGEERRSGGGSRASDQIAEHFKLLAAAIGVALTLITAGVAWGVSSKTIDAKVDRTEFITKNNEQDSQNAILAARQDRYEAVMINEVIPKLSKIDARVSAIYCDKKPPGCQ